MRKTDPLVANIREAERDLVGAMEAVRVAELKLGQRLHELIVSKLGVGSVAAVGMNQISELHRRLSRVGVKTQRPMCHARAFQWAGSGHSDDMGHSPREELENFIDRVYQPAFGFNPCPVTHEYTPAVNAGAPC